MTAPVTRPDEGDIRPVDPALAQAAMRIAIMKARANEAAANLKAVRDGAQGLFRPARMRGVPNVEVRMPDGTRLGLISIQRGGEVWKVDEDELLLVAALNDSTDLEQVIDPRALRDPKVVEFITANCGEYVKTALTGDARARYEKEWRENGGQVSNLLLGERVKVADVEYLDPTGEFTYKPVPNADRLIAQAIEAGVINEWGEPVAPPVTAAEPVAGALDSGPQVTHAAGCEDPACGGCSDPEPPGELPPPPDEPPDEPPPPPEPVETAEEPPGPAPAPRPAGRGSRAALTPTGEQQAVLDAWTGTSDNLTIRAAAGAGKTSTLVMLGQATRAGGMYLAYNAAIAAEAKRKLPRNVACSTAHSLAFRAVGVHYRDRLDSPRVPARETAKILGINEPLQVTGDRKLAPDQVARLVMETVGRFMRSADREPDRQHVPAKNGLDSIEAMDVLRKVLVPLARKAWEDLTIPSDDPARAAGRLKYSHDCYLKQFQLTDPQLDADYVFFDEAQDADPVIAAILVAQKNLRLVTVGDPNQEIYTWRGAQNAMDAFGGRQFTLSQSFRFGPAVAREANKWLSLLDTDMQVEGSPRISSILRTLEYPDAVLCRTNGGAIKEAMDAIAAGNRTAIVGGGKPLKALAEAAAALKAGRPTSHPELFAFGSWAEVQDYAENDPAGSDLQVLVKLIDDHGPEEIIRVVDSLSDERTADVVVSTAHKAKGLEWNSVRIARDFRAPKRNEDGTQPDVPAADARLAYVAVTRAQLSLDREGLAWVDRFLPGGAS